jgi:predicted dehydrogenase
VKNSLKMGLVGMTSDHVWNMAQNLVDLPTVDLVTGADPHQDLAEQVQERCHLKTIYQDYVEMFDKENVDAIMICGDNASKAGIVEEAARRGVHVYQDKPMAATLSQADQILAAAERSGIKLMVAYHTVFSPSYAMAKSWLDEGKVGDVYLATAAVGHAGPKAFGCSDYFCEWLFSKEKNGGGTFIDEGCYYVTAFLDYVGEVAEVSSFMAQIGDKDYLPPGVEDNAVVNLRFKNGALGVIHSKWGQIGVMPYSASYHGTEGTLLAKPQALSLYSRSELPGDLQGWVEVPFPHRPYGMPIAEAEYFVNCVLEDKPVEGPVSPRRARATQEVIEAAYRSAETGKPVALPL